jgi:hypothetical protein
MSRLVNDLGCRPGGGGRLLYIASLMATDGPEKQWRLYIYVVSDIWIFMWLVTSVYLCRQPHLNIDVVSYVCKFMKIVTCEYLFVSYICIFILLVTSEYLCRQLNLYIYHSWALSPISVISDIGLSLILECPISNWRALSPDIGINFCLISDIRQ